MWTALALALCHCSSPEEPSSFQLHNATPLAHPYTCLLHSRQCQALIPESVALAGRRCQLQDFKRQQNQELCIGAKGFSFQTTNAGWIALIGCRGKVADIQIPEVLAVRAFPPVSLPASCRRRHNSVVLQICNSARSAIRRIKATLKATLSCQR